MPDQVIIKWELERVGKNRSAYYCCMVERVKQQSGAYLLARRRLGPEFRHIWAMTARTHHTHGRTTHFKGNIPHVSYC